MSVHYEAKLRHKVSGKVVFVAFTSPEDIKEVRGFDNHLQFAMARKDIQRALFAEDEAFFEIVHCAIVP